MGLKLTGGVGMVTIELNDAQLLDALSQIKRDTSHIATKVQKFLESLEATSSIDPEETP